MNGNMLNTFTKGMMVTTKMSFYLKFGSPQKVFHYIKHYITYKPQNMT